jgi:uncharacterized protein YaaR (DUF327 family)
MLFSSPSNKGKSSLKAKTFSAARSYKSFVKSSFLSVVLNIKYEYSHVNSLRSNRWAANERDFSLRPWSLGAGKKLGGEW